MPKECMHARILISLVGTHPVSLYLLPSPVLCLAAVELQHVAPTYRIPMCTVADASEAKAKVATIGEKEPKGEMMKEVVEEVEVQVVNSPALKSARSASAVPKVAGEQKWV